MKKLIALIILIIVLAAAWYLGSPLFIDKVVDEQFPVANVVNTTANDMEMMKNLTPEEVNKLTKGEQRDLKLKMDDLAANMPDVITADAMPTGPTALSVGTFVGVDSFHNGSGKATVYSLEDGQNLLRFEDFDVTNGPALHVYLVKDASGDVDSGFIDLGELKGNKGSQNYTIAEDIDVTQYNSVVIWCKPFAVTFAIAPLN
jgi:hypothetical protein